MGDTELFLEAEGENWTLPGVLGDVFSDVFRDCKTGDVEEGGVGVLMMLGLGDSLLIDLLIDRILSPQALTPLKLLFLKLVTAADM